MRSTWWVDGRPLGERASDASRVAAALRLARGVFTTTRITDGLPVRAEVHVARLLHDAAQLGLPLVEEGDALLQAYEVAATADGADRHGVGVLRLLLAADEHDVPMLIASTSLAPMTPSAPVTVATVEGARRPAQVKSMSWAWSDHAGRIARDQGAETALLVEDGDVLELASANIVIVTADGSVTPRADGRLLPGTTRATLLDAPTLDLIEATVPVDALRHADELVLLSALRGAVPITHVDGRQVGNGGLGPWAAAAQAALGAVGLGPAWPSGDDSPTHG